jgi:4-hydroxy-tetrahydrodipicolinate reductase
MTHTLAIVGLGKMGRAVTELAPSRGWKVVAQLDRASTANGITRELICGADVAVEFTTPSAAVDNTMALLRAGCPVVVGTTGWYDRLPEVANIARDSGSALLTAANFSLGVNIFEQVVIRAAELLSRTPGFEAHIVETHHSAKKDAPSGTAGTLAASASAAWGKQIPITSVRVGSVPGTHEFVFDAPFEQIHLEHIARDRRVFAEGALVAAGWLIGKHGVFTMKDVVSSTGRTS